MRKLRALWNWLYEARFTLLCLGVTALAISFSLRPQTPEWIIRWIGGVLQLLGVLTVVWGVIKTRAFFGLPPVHSKVRAWLKRFPLLRRSVNVSATASMGLGLSMQARGYSIHGAGENPTTETRLDALEENLKVVHSRITDSQREMDEGFQGLTSALKAESEVRASEVAKLGNTVRDYSTGGLHIAAMGAVWLFVGVVLSTFAIELEIILK